MARDVFRLARRVSSDCVGAWRERAAFVPVCGLFSPLLIYKEKRDGNEEIYERPYYVQANMSKYIASIIDFMNHDVSTENVQIPAEKIHAILNRYNNRLPLDED